MADTGGDADAFRLLQELQMIHMRSGLMDSMRHQVESAVVLRHCEVRSTLLASANKLPTTKPAVCPTKARAVPFGSYSCQFSGSCRGCYQASDAPQARQQIICACAALGQLQTKRRQLQDANTLAAAEQQAAAMHAHILPALARWQHTHAPLTAALASLSAALQSSEAHVFTYQVRFFTHHVRFLTHHVRFRAGLQPCICDCRAAAQCAH